MRDGWASEPQGENADAVPRLLTSVEAESYRRVRVQALQESPPTFGSLPENEPDLAATAVRHE